jgi:DNA polymerase elongation subunit (family B)
MVLNCRNLCRRCEEFAIVDIDVASLYPSIAIVNKLYPEHLGIRFVEEYARLPLERKNGRKRRARNALKRTP